MRALRAVERANVVLMVIDAEEGVTDQDQKIIGYANDGLTLYFLCGLDSQKAANIARDPRVSLTINDDPSQVMEIKGLSMAANAEAVTDRAEAEKAMRLLFSRYPEQTAAAPLPDLPKPEEVRIVRLTPKVVSVLDYTKGFNHTDLVTC
jgi:general stress protein 26